MPGTKNVEMYLIKNIKIISKIQVLECYCTSEDKDVRTKVPGSIGYVKIVLDSTVGKNKKMVPAAFFL